MEFGKLNFSTSFNPTSAFPLDARSFFTSLAEAEAAAATAQEVGSTETVYYFGMKVLVSENETDTWYTIQRPGVLAKEGTGEVETVSLLIDGVNYAIDNISDPEPTESEDEYQLEVTQ